MSTRTSSNWLIPPSRKNCAMDLNPRHLQFEDVGVVEHVGVSLLVQNLNMDHLNLTNCLIIHRNTSPVAAVKTTTTEETDIGAWPAAYR